MEKAHELFYQLLDALLKGRLFPLQIFFFWQLTVLFYLHINRAACGESTFQHSLWSSGIITLIFKARKPWHLREITGYGQVQTWSEIGGFFKWG